MATDASTLQAAHRGFSPRDYCMTCMTIQSWMLSSHSRGATSDSWRHSLRFRISKMVVLQLVFDTFKVTKRKSSKPLGFYSSSWCSYQPWGPSTEPGMVNVTRTKRLEKVQLRSPSSGPPLGTLGGPRGPLGASLGASGGPLGASGDSWGPSGASGSPGRAPEGLLGEARKLLGAGSQLRGR